MRAILLVTACYLVLAPVQARAQSAGAELADLWRDADGRCRGGRGDDPRTDAACEERGRYAKRLAALGFCLGDGGRDWRPCAASPPPAARPRVSCIVDDPTPTPLNYRTSPNGDIMGSVRNGRRVTVLDSATDPQGRPWVYIADADGTPLGWVFKRYVSCL